MPNRMAIRMSKQLTVQIDLKLVQQHCSNCDGRTWSEEEVQQWLSDVGFKADGLNTWNCEAEALFALTPDEIIELLPTT